MHPLDGTVLSSFPVVGLEKVCDLIYHDGPLLSHFKHSKKGDHFLYYWCDCDDKVNRWMVCRVSETNVLRLVNRFVPLNFVIPKSCQDDFVYFVDLNNSGSPAKVTLTPIKNIPPDYTPEAGAYLGEDIQKLWIAANTYSVIIEKGFTMPELSEFPRRFTQAYAFLYLLMILKPSHISGHPWRGGFSSMHFYKDIVDSIPGEERPALDAVQYASPGFIRFKSINEEVITKLNSLIVENINRSDREDAYSELATYIRKNGLNEIRSEDDPRWSNHDGNLSTMAVVLLKQNNIPNADLFLSATNRPFEAAKVSMSFVKRLRKLASYDSDGVVRFPGSSMFNDPDADD